MARSYLAVINDMCARIGMSRPVSIVSNSNDLPVQLRAIFFESARDVTRSHDWQVLTRAVSFSTTSSALQLTLLSAVPDFRRMVPETFVNETQGRRILPMNALEYSQFLMSGGPIPHYRYRLRSGVILFPGNTTSGDVCTFEYVSTYWLTDSSGATRKGDPTADTDLVLIDDELIILNAKWRFKKESGLEYGEDFNDYQRALQAAKGEDSESLRLSIGGGRSSMLLNQNVEFEIPIS